MQVHYGCIPPLIHNEISKALCKGFLQYFFLMYYTYVVIVFLGTYLGTYFVLKYRGKV